MKYRIRDAAATTTITIGKKDWSLDFDGGWRLMRKALLGDID